jgi:hypothetical protein
MDTIIFLEICHNPPFGGLSPPAPITAKLCIGVGNLPPKGRSAPEEAQRLYCLVQLYQSLKLGWVATINYISSNCFVNNLKPLPIFCTLYEGVV